MNLENNNKDGDNASRSDKMMDDELLDKQSYNSGSLGAMQAANQGQQTYMNMLSSAPRRQTLQVNPKALGQVDQQMLAEQNQLQM